MAVADIYNMPVRSITYSERYSDDTYEYRLVLQFPKPLQGLWPTLLRRHVILPPEMVSLVPKTHLMTETEWRNIGIQQSTGWQHFMLHHPEPYVLLFRRPKPPSEAPSSSSNNAESENNTEQSSNVEEKSDPTEESSAN